MRTPVIIRSNGSMFSIEHANNHRLVSNFTNTGWTASAKSASVWRDADTAKEFAMSAGFDVLRNWQSIPVVAPSIPVVAPSIVPVSITGAIPASVTTDSPASVPSVPTAN